MWKKVWIIETLSMGSTNTQSEDNSNGNSVELDKTMS